jgi:hypothetical protein
MAHRVIRLQPDAQLSALDQPEQDDRDRKEGAEEDRLAGGHFLCGRLDYCGHEGEQHDRHHLERDAHCRSGREILDLCQGSTPAGR